MWTEGRTERSELCDVDRGTDRRTDMTELSVVLFYFVKVLRNSVCTSQKALSFSVTSKINAVYSGYNRKYVNILWVKLVTECYNVLYIYRSVCCRSLR